MYRRSVFYFSLVLAIAILGFFPSYFSVLLRTDAVHHFHGGMATTWMMLLIGQAWLVRQGRLSLHRTLGRLSLIVVPLFLLSGLLVVNAMLKSRSGFSQTFAARLAFVDIASVLYFGLSYGLAIAYRKNVQLHARFMASTAILVLPPALARLLPMVFPAIQSFPVAFHLSYLLSQVTVVVLLLDDHRQGGLRMPYLLLLGVMLLQELGFIVIPQIPWWNELVTRLGT